MNEIPTVGETIRLLPAGATEGPTVRITASHGDAVLLAVVDDDGQAGIVAFQPTGRWWWVREIEPREPWQADNPNAWRASS